MTVKAYIEVGEIEKLENAALYLRDRLLIRLLSHLGCRISEALAVKVDDVDFTQGTVIIKHLKTRLKLSCPGCGVALGKSHTFCPGCGTKVERALIRQMEHGRQRVLPLESDTLIR